MAEHYTLVCEYDTRHGTCRCPSPNKAERRISCPTPERCAARPAPARPGTTEEADRPRFYLAARYSRREELLGVRDVIEALGGEVTSRWLNGDHQLSDTGTPIGDHGEALVEGGDGERAATLRAKFAQDDYDDVMRADVIVAFTEVPRSAKNRGGRHVELGLGLAWGKRVIVVGPRENVFCWLPQIEHYPSWGGGGALAITRLLTPDRGAADG